jgi:hypothetical protein
MLSRETSLAAIPMFCEHKGHQVACTRPLAHFP